MTYDPEGTDAEVVMGRVEAAGYTVEILDAKRSESLSIPEMDCPSCANKVGNALDGVKGLMEYDLQPTTGTATVSYDPEATNHSAIVGAIEGTGYEVEAIGYSSPISCMMSSVLMKFPRLTKRSGW